MGAIQTLIGNDSEPDNLVVELGKLAGPTVDPSALQNAVHLLQRNGWVFVKLTPQFEELSSQSSKAIAHYFTQTPQEDKEKHTELLGSSTALDGAVYGYNMQAGFKEGLRLLTGGRLNPLWVPQEIESQVNKYVTALDEVMLQILKGLSNSLFQKKDLSSLPFLKGSPQSTSNFTKDNFAMLDIVYYQNHNPNSTTSISVAEHYDPGLLSLNVLSTQPGLQFKTTSGKWFDVPENVGVLWAGEYASRITKKTIKPAVHRVVTPNPKDYPHLPPQHSFLPRLSIWIEICTAMQDLALSIPAMQEVIMDEEQNATFPNISFDISRILSNDEDGPTGPPMASITLLPGENLEAALHRVSSTYGVPMTKSITYYCPICVDSVHDLLSHFQEEHKSTPLIKE